MSNLRAAPEYGIAYCPVGCGSDYVHDNLQVEATGRLTCANGAQVQCKSCGGYFWTKAYMALEDARSIGNMR